MGGFCSGPSTCCTFVSCILILWMATLVRADHGHESACQHWDHENNVCLDEHGWGWIWVAAGALIVGLLLLGLLAWVAWGDDGIDHDSGLVYAEVREEGDSGSSSSDEYSSSGDEPAMPPSFPVPPRTMERPMTRRPVDSPSEEHNRRRLQDVGKEIQTLLQ